MKDLNSVQLVVFDANGRLVPLFNSLVTPSGGGIVLATGLILQTVGNQGGADPTIVTAGADTTDAVIAIGTGPTSGLGAMFVLSRGTIFNGATWDRCREVIGDAQAATGIPVSHATLWNGATYDRKRSASAANLAAESGVGAQLSTTPGQWSIFSAPAAHVVATATKAASPGVSHILTTISASLQAVAAQAAPVQLVVRDGASGVGAIIWTERLFVTTGFDIRFTVSGLSLVGTAGNAMTVEFTAAADAGNFETLSATGYDAT